MSNKEIFDKVLKSEMGRIDYFARELRQSIDSLTSLMNGPQDGSSFGFHIYIGSEFADQGERDVEVVFHNVSLEEAMRLAIENFKDKNKRGDVQGNYLVWAVTPTDREVTVPRDMWMPFHEKYGKLPTREISQD